MASRHFHLLCSVDVGEQAQAKTLRVWGVSKAIHRQRGLRRVKCLPYSIVQFIIRNGAPVRGINIRHGISIYNKANIFFQYFYFNFSFPNKKKKKSLHLQEDHCTKYIFTFFFPFLKSFNFFQGNKVNNVNNVMLSFIFFFLNSYFLFFFQGIKLSEPISATEF